MAQFAYRAITIVTVAMRGRRSLVCSLMAAAL
jgi:hypothetical protein